VARPGTRAARVDLYWLPLGAGDTFPVVRWNGLLFEALAAWHQHRQRANLYHAALEVYLDDTRFVIELAPAWGDAHTDHGVVNVGPVGMPWLGRTPLFRYEVRRWRSGSIPDIAWAVGPRCVAHGGPHARKVLELMADFPTATWGRDELGTGDMWNSNSLIAWLLERAHINTADTRPPAGGRAPGWSAGLVVAKRQNNATSYLPNEEWLPPRSSTPGRMISCRVADRVGR
jgi:hypothetical protein